MVNPSDEIKTTYKFLLECEELIINELKHDVQLCDVYKLVREKVENEQPELVNKMTNTLGFVFIFCLIEKLIYFKFLERH